MFDELALPITTMASASCGDGLQRGLTVGGREAEVAAGRGPQFGELAPGRAPSMPSQSCIERVVCASSATFAGVGDGGQHAVEVAVVLHQADGVGRHREGARRLVVTAVAHVEDGEALAGAHLGLVVHLGDERAHRVDHEAALVARGGHHLGRRSVGREHERRAGGHVVHVVDEHHAELAEAVDHEPVVDDLVVAVHRRLEDPHHPRQGLDRHLDAGTEPPWLGEQHRSTAIPRGYPPPSPPNLRRRRADMAARRRKFERSGRKRPGRPVDWVDADRPSGGGRARLTG